MAARIEVDDIPQRVQAYLRPHWLCLLAMLPQRDMKESSSALTLLAVSPELVTPPRSRLGFDLPALHFDLQALYWLCFKI